MLGFDRPSRPRGAVLLLIAATATLGSACSGNRHRLRDYDFRGRTLAVVTMAPARPDIFTGASLRVDPEKPLESLFRVGSEVAREAGAYRARARLDSAAAAVNVSERMAERTLQNAARQLRAQPVTGTPNVDYELEIRVRHYGIVADSWTSNAYYTIDAEVLLLDGATGRRIWMTHVRARDPVRTTVDGASDRSVTNVITAVTLASMSAGEIERALESLADFAADRMVERLAESLDDARR